MEAFCALRLVTWMVRKIRGLPTWGQERQSTTGFGLSRYYFLALCIIILSHLALSVPCLFQTMPLSDST